MNQPTWTPYIGGCGGAFLLATPGELTIDLEKRDLHRQPQPTALRAILCGPDRQVLQEALIPDDGAPPDSGPGPAQRVRLTATVERPGIHALMLTLSNDRYGESASWRLRTNCPRYLLETSRGHRDARHEEPLVLRDPERPATVCFLPRASAFAIEVSDLPDNVEALRVTDDTGQSRAILKATGGRAAHSFAAEEDRGAAPWQLHLPSAQATVQIDGVTRWEAGDPCADLSLWSPQPDSWFPLHPYRWLITPYNRTVYGRPGEQKTIDFQLCNNSLQEGTFKIELEFPEAAWEVRSTQTQVRLQARAKTRLILPFVIPAEERAVHVRVRPADHPGCTTYATLRVLPGAPRATQPLSLPLVLKPFRHEPEQFGYRPDYPVENQVYFDPANRPFVRTSEGLMSWQDRAWKAAGAAQPVGSAHAGPWTKVAFDTAGQVYALAMAQHRPTLFHSLDQGQTLTGYPLPESAARTFDIEQFSGHNLPEEPPPILRYTPTHRDPNLFWRKYGTLELLLPRKTGSGLAWEEAIFLSDKSLGLSSHSGIPSSIVSRGARIHLVWGEATPPDGDAPGVPALAATYDRQTGELSEPVLIGYGAPPNDVHNTPCIAIDSQGYLHVLTGTHGSPFHYACSLAPNDTQAGWTAPAPVGEGLRQTYIGLVCGPDDTLHLAFRLWRQHADYFPAGYFAALAYMSKPPGKPWSAPQTLIVAPLSEYSIYYHRLTIDRRGRLFLSYDYWSTFWFYRTDYPDRRRALLMSPDGGRTWKLAEDADWHG